MNLNKKSNEHYLMASIKNTRLQNKFRSYLNCLKEEEKVAKNGGELFKQKINLNKRLSRLKCYQKFKTEIENDYEYEYDILKSNSQLEVEHRFRSNSNFSNSNYEIETHRKFGSNPNFTTKINSTSKLPPLERCTVVISPQKNEFNVYKVLDGKLRLKEKSTYQGMKNYLNYKSESELDRWAQSQQFEARNDLESRMTKLKNYVTNEFEDSTMNFNQSSFNYN